MTEIKISRRDRRICRKAWKVFEKIYDKFFNENEDGTYTVNDMRIIDENLKMDIKMSLEAFHKATIVLSVFEPKNAKYYMEEKKQ